MNFDQLGISKDALVEMVVDKIANTILDRDENNGDDDFTSNVETRYRERLSKEVDKAMADAIAKAVNVTSREAVASAVQAAVESTAFQETNRYGEPQKPVKTWREMLIDRADTFLMEQVDADGKPTGSGGYGAERYKTTRAAWLVYQYIGDHLQKKMAEVMAAANQQIVGGLKKAVTDKIDSIQIALTQPR